tara:strand:+ start:370 stop:594 length:225 start_codon:yes stop_codon:yes gene_type:complete
MATLHHGILTNGFFSAFFDPLPPQVVVEGASSGLSAGILFKEMVGDKKFFVNILDTKDKDLLDVSVKLLRSKDL